VNIIDALIGHNPKIIAAQDPNTEQETLELLATDEDPDVRYWLAKNPNIPKESLQLLATDENPAVRQYVAKNPNIPKESLQLLATDENSYVRYCVTQNPNRTELIERLVLMTDHKLAQALDPTT